MRTQSEAFKEPHMYLVLHRQRLDARYPYLIYTLTYICNIYMYIPYIQAEVCLLISSYTYNMYIDI